MPTLPPCLTVDLLITVANRFQSSSRLYWEPTTVPTGNTDMNAAAGNWSGLYATVVKALLSSDAHFDGVRIAYRDGTNEFIGESSEAAGFGAATDDPMLPNEVVYEIQRKTGKQGRSNRGRIFISGGPEIANDAGNVTDAYVTKLKALAAKISPDQTVSPFGICHARHWNRKAGTLVGVSSCRVATVFVSRRDRRNPHRITTS